MLKMYVMACSDMSHKLVCSKPCWWGKSIIAVTDMSSLLGGGEGGGGACREMYSLACGLLSRAKL